MTDARAAAGMRLTGHVAGSLLIVAGVSLLPVMDAISKLLFGMASAGALALAHGWASR